MNLPKKLDYIQYETSRELAGYEVVDNENRNKINELIDYLSDKEASKGEGRQCDYCGQMSCIHKDQKQSHPPQQEESRGECACPCHDPSQYRPHKEGHGCCDKAVKPQLKEELRDGGICLFCGETMYVPKNQMAGAVHDKCRPKQPVEEWKEWAGWLDMKIYDWESNTKTQITLPVREEIKDFIRQLLAKSEQQIREEGVNKAKELIKKLRNKHPYDDEGDYGSWYRDGVEDSLNALSSLKEGKVV